MMVLSKKFIKNILVSMLTLILTFSLTINVFAAATPYVLLKYELNGGVGNWGYNKRYYWNDSSASEISDTINAAYNSWIYTSHILETPISWRQTTTKSSGTVEFYTYSSSDNKNGYTSFWRYNTQVSPNSQNWGWCIIYYNTNYTGGQATLAHEIGHTLGLNENNSNPDTVMCQMASGRRVSTPQLGDLQGINTKYN